MSNFAWEVQKALQEKTLISVLEPPGGVSLQWALAFSTMDKPQICDPLRLAGLPWGEARTQAALMCLNGGYEWLFQLDADVIPPKEVIFKLMSHHLPIVSGLYYQRFPTSTGVISEYLPCMFNEGPNGEGVIVKQPITEYPPGTLIEAAYVPAGCLMVHRTVFEKFIQAGIKRVFEWTLTADSNPPGSGRSEDFEFAARARALGFKCYVDTSVSCIHETDAMIGNKGIVPKV